VSSVKKVADIIAEIKAAFREAVGNRSGNKAVRQMDQITRQNAALGEERRIRASHDPRLGVQDLVTQFKLEPNFLASCSRRAIKQQSVGSECQSLLSARAPRARGESRWGSSIGRGVGKPKLAISVSDATENASRSSRTHRWRRRRYSAVSSLFPLYIGTIIKKHYGRTYSHRYRLHEVRE